MRFCEPELKVCNSGIVWKAEDGTRLFLRRAEDMHGQPREREVCEINAFGDVRVCFDWDTNATSRDMKDGNGHWLQGRRPISLASRARAPRLTEKR